MHIALINLGLPNEVLSCLEALYTSGFYDKDKNVYYLIVRSEFLEQYDISSMIDVHFIGVDSALVETVLSQKNAKNIFITYPHLTNKYDIVINFSLTQVSLYLTTQMSANQKLGPLLSEKGKMILNDEWSQVLYAQSESKQHFFWSNSEIYIVIFQRILSKMNLSYTATPIINNNFVKTYIESKNSPQMCVLIPENLMGWNFWSQILLQATKRLEIKYVKLFAGDQLAAKVMQTLVPMGVDVDIFDRYDELWPVIKASDYYIGPPLEVSPLQSLLQIPSLFVCKDWQELYTQQTLNPMHYWQCLEGWDNQGSQLAILLAPVIQKMVNLEQIIDMAKTEGTKVAGLCFRFQGLKVQSTTSVSYQSATAHSFRILWQFYFYQADHFVKNTLQSQADSEEIKKRIAIIGLMVRAYEFMKHHCLKAIKKEELTLAESREIRNAINDIQKQIDTLSNSFKDISSIANFFRAKLSAMSETDLQDAAETLVLTVQEAGSCYLAVKDLLEQSLMSYNNLTNKSSS